MRQILAQAEIKEADEMVLDAGSLEREKRSVLLVPMFSWYGVAELDDQLFYPIEIKRLDTDYLLVIPLATEHHCLRYSSAVLAEQKCREEREWGASWKQPQTEIMASMVSYFPDWEGATVSFIKAITGQMFSVSHSTGIEPVRAWLPGSGYTCAYGTYHLVVDGYGNTRDEALSQLADHVYEVECQCRHICGGPRYRLKRGQNLLYPITKRSYSHMFCIWLKLLLFLASLILAGGGLSDAFLQIKHFG